MLGWIRLRFLCSQYLSGHDFTFLILMHLNFYLNFPEKLCKRLKVINKELRRQKLTETNADKEVYKSLLNRNLKREITKCDES